jgi:hypothetical protein
MLDGLVPFSGQLKMKRDYSLFESFTKHGIWWLSGRPEDRVRGDLVFHEDHTKLKLFGAFEGTESVFVSRNDYVILGSCGEEDITLLNCGLRGSWDVMKDPITSTWWCQFALIGLHAIGGFDHGFTDAEVRFTGLEYWIGDDPIVDQFPPDAEYPLRTLRIEHNHEEPRDFDVTVIDANFGLTASCNQSGADYKVSLEHRAYIRISPTEPRNLLWFIETQHQFQRMLSFFADASVQTLTLRLFSKGESALNTPNGCLIWPATQRKDNSERLNRGMLIRFPDVASRFTDVLNIWYANAERLKHVYNQFFAATQHDVIYVDQDFLQLTQALEVYSRVARSRKYVTDAEYKEIADTLIASIPQGTNCDLRNSLKARIKFGNEYSLRKRIATILKELEPETVELLTQDITAFVSRVVDTRNFLVHLDDTSSGNAFKESELYPAMNRLRLLLMILLFRELQFTDSETREIIKRSSVFRYGI